MDEWNIQLTTAYHDGNDFPVGIPKFEEILSTDIGDQISEWSISGDHLAAQPTLVQFGGSQIQPNQFADVHLGPSLRPIFAARQVRSRGRENVPAMKCRRQSRADHPMGIGDLSRAFDAIPILHQRHQAVIRKNEVLSALRFYDGGLASAAHRRVDDHHKHRAGGIVWCRAIKEACAIQDGEWGHLMRQVDNPQLGSDRIHHALAYVHGIIHHTEVGHEYYRGRIFGFCRLCHQVVGQQDASQRQYDQDPGESGRNGVLRHWVFRSRSWLF